MPRRRQVKWSHPFGIENDYVVALRKLARGIRDLTNRDLMPILPRIMDRAYQHRVDSYSEDDGYISDLTPIVDAISGGLTSGITQAYAAAKHYGGQANAFNARQFHKVARSALGVDVFKAEPWLADELRAWEAANLRLIRSIPQQHSDKLQTKIMQALREGQSLKQLQDTVRTVYPMTDNRAELIARDQIGKLNGQLTMLRQTGIGVKEYRWRGVLDRRERILHREREGVSFKWSEPPSDGNPGQPINCRCWAEAVFPALADLDVQVIPR